MERARVEASMVGGGVAVEGVEEEEKALARGVVSLGVVVGENDEAAKPRRGASSSPLRPTLDDPLGRPIPELESRRQLRELAAVDREKSRERPRASEERRRSDGERGGVIIVSHLF